MVVGGVRKEIGERNGMGGPDDLTSSKVPPHIRVVETRSHRQHSQHNQKAGQHRGE